MENENKLDMINEKIKLRNNWLKIFVTVIITIVLVYKVITNSIIIDFSKVDFSVLLSLILAFFSIGLSVVFFFKASETSTLFYDNTYKFTKDMSTMLGRIESGFGERLRHLDEGYVGLRDRFDKMPFNREKAEEEIKTNTEEMERALNERNKVIEDLAEKAKLNQNQKEQLLQNLNDKENKLLTMQQELFFLKKRLEKDKLRALDDDIDIIPGIVKRHLMMRVFPQIRNNLAEPDKLPFIMFKKKIRQIYKDLDNDFLLDATKFGLFDDDGNPSRKLYTLYLETCGSTF